MKPTFDELLSLATVLHEVDPPPGDQDPRTGRDYGMERLAVYGLTKEYNLLAWDFAWLAHDPKSDRYIADMRASHAAWVAGTPDRLTDTVEGGTHGDSREAANSIF